MIRRAILALLLVAVPAWADYDQYLKTISSTCHHYKLSEQSGTVAGDSPCAGSGGFNFKYVNSPTLGVSPGPLQYGPGTAITCDGTNDYVGNDGGTTGQGFNVTTANNFTVLMWAKQSATGFLAGRAGSASNNYQWHVQNSNSALWQSSCCAMYEQSLPSAGISSTQYTFVGFTWTSSGTTLKSYIDGQVDGTDNTTSGTLYTTDTLDVSFCRRGLDPDFEDFWGGNIGEVITDQAAFTQPQIEALWKIGTGRQPRRRSR